MARTDPALARHVEHVLPSFERLFDAGDAVEALTASPGWEAVQLVLAAEVDAINVQLERPGVREQAEYAAAHGRIGGLKAAAAAAGAIADVAAKRREAQEANQERAGESAAER